MANKTKLEKLNEIKEKLNESIDRKIERELVLEAADKVKTAPLTEAADIFESVMDKLLNKKSGRKCIKEYVETIRENKSLKQAYLAMRIIDNPVNINESKIFTDTLFRVMQDIDRKKLNEGVDKLRNIVSEAVVVSKVGADELDELLENVKSPLNESVEYLFENTCSTSNLVEWSNKVAAIANYIEEKKVEEPEEDTYGNPGELFEQLNALVGDGMDANSKVLMSVSEAVLNGVGMEELFESYRTSCIEAIDKLYEGASVEEQGRLEGMKLSLNNKQYREETLTEDLLKMSELKEVLNESVEE